MRLLQAPAALLCVTLLGACSTPSIPVVVKPRPSAALLEACTDPAVVPNPEAATDNDIALMMLNLAKAYADCKERQANLAKFVREQ